MLSFKQNCKIWHWKSKHLALCSTHGGWGRVTWGNAAHRGVEGLVAGEGSVDAGSLFMSWGSLTFPFWSLQLTPLLYGIPLSTFMLSLLPSDNLLYKNLIYMPRSVPPRGFWILLSWQWKLTITAIKIKTTPGGGVVIKKIRNSKCWWWCGERNSYTLLL